MFFIFFQTNGQVRQILINPAQTYQKIDHFTASDAWSGNFVGQYWDTTQKEQIAQWLFSQDFDETGSPVGIGLSMWRVNLGAGTLEQDHADIVPFQRRAESFLTKDGKSYDWGKCAGQQYFMQKATEYGCNNFLLFSNSPPIPYTKNRKGWAPSDNSANITEEGYRLFANYMADVAQHFINERGWNISFISPVNEPQVDWTSPRQEGSPWRSSEIKRLTTELNSAISHRGLKGIRILLAESDRLQRLYQENTAQSEKKRFGNDGPFNQIYNFFDAKSQNYVGGLAHVAGIISAHDYHSHSDNRLLKDVREKVKKRAQQYDLEFHQTEWCLLPNPKLPMDGFTEGWVPDNYADMQTALLMGRLIYGNMVYANATGWGYWKGMEIKGNHALISLFPEDGNIMSGGVVRSNKLLWALGNYSFFIRPGYERIDVAGADDLDTLVASAYISPDRSRIVVVLVNSTFSSSPVEISFPDSVLNDIKHVSVFRTDGRTDLGNLDVSTQFPADGQFIISPRAITSMVFQLK